MVLTTRRRFLRLIALGSGSALLAACAPAAPAPTAAPTKPAATPVVVPTQPPPVAKPAPTQAPAAAKPADASTAEVKDASFVVVDGTEPSSLDPPVGTGPFQHILNGMFEGLVTWNERMEVEPVLATAWEPSQDGKTWTFKLRQGVKFHDGTPFTSQAVKTTIDHILDKDTQSGRRSSYTLITEVAAPDDQTVQISTDPPTPDLPFLMADGSARIISPAALQKFGKDFGRNPVGTGPYKFEEWVPNDHVSAVVNPDYWRVEKPRVRRMVYRPIPEAAGRVVVLRTGEADVVMNLPPADVESLRQDANVTVNVTPSLTVVEAEPAQSKPPFNDVRVRTALNQAIDKDAIIKNIMRGLARPLNTPSIPGLWGTFELEALAYDPARAKQLLAEAGHPNGLDITLYYVSGRWAGDDQVVEAMQGYWTNAGLRTTLKKVQMAEISNITREDPDTRAGTLGFLIKTSEFVDYHLYRMYHSKATNIPGTAQRTAYSNPEVDRLLDLQRQTFDQTKRLEILKQVQEILWKDQPLLFVFHQVNIWGQRNNVSGFRFIPTNHILPATVQKA